MRMSLPGLGADGAAYPAPGGPAESVSNCPLGYDPCQFPGIPNPDQVAGFPTVLTLIVVWFPSVE